MKKIIGYGVAYLFGLICILSMIFRVDSLDSNISKNDYDYKDIYVFKENI